MKRRTDDLAASRKTRVFADGRDLGAEDFKRSPEGHTGGALNIVPAHVGYLTANVLSAQTRGWLMGQGHCVAAIDTVNLLADNPTPARTMLQIHVRYRAGVSGVRTMPALRGMKLPEVKALWEWLQAMSGGE